MAIAKRRPQPRVKDSQAQKVTLRFTQLSLGRETQTKSGETAMSKRLKFSRSV